MSFKGISFEQSSGARSVTFPIGFRGISIETPVNIRFIKVCDYRGVPYVNAKIILYNAGGLTLESFTNEQGIAQIVPDQVGTVTFDIEQQKTIERGIPYTFANEGITKTVVIQSSTSHIIL